MARKPPPPAPPSTSKKRKSTLERRIREIRKELAALKKFRRTKQRDLFIRRLAGEQRLVERQLSRLPTSRNSVKGKVKVERATSKAAAPKSANDARAGKMIKYHNYLRQIRNNYPDLTYAQLRRQFSERKRGIKTEVPDVVWRNPSP